MGGFGFGGLGGLGGFGGFGFGGCGGLGGLGGGVGVGGGVADDELEDFSEVAGEDDESKEGSAEQGVRGDFAEDVAGENAHFFAAW